MGGKPALGDKKIEKKRKNVETPSELSLETYTNEEDLQEDEEAKEHEREDLPHDKSKEIKPISIPLSDSIKRRLAMDWEQVAKGQKVHCLPAEVTVSMIIDSYLRSQVVDK